MTSGPKDGGRVRAAVYARLSRPKDKAELGANIGDQASIGVDLVRRRGWTLVADGGVEAFVDDGRGAFRDDAKRPAWERLLASKPDVIVVRDGERLGRNVPDYARLLETKARVVEWMDEEDADVRWEAEPVSTDTDEFGQKMLGARSYSRKISTKVKRKVRTKAAAGAWPHGGTRPFGYHHPGPKSQCCPEGTPGCEPGAVIESEAEVIREVAERWLAGESLSALCRDLTTRGITTPAGKPWQYARLRNMLAGPRIAGIRTHNGVEVKGTWDAIVDEDLHRRLVTAASESMTKRVGQNSTYVLSGLLTCGKCGKSMYGHRQHGRGRIRLRYVCVDGCGQGIAVPGTDELVSGESFFAILAPDLRDREHAQREVEGLGGEVTDLEARLEELDRAYWQERVLTKDRWLAQSAELSAALDETRARLREARGRLTRDRNLPETAEELGERWRDADNRERNRLLRLAVDRVIIHPRGKAPRFDPTRCEIHFLDGRTYRATTFDVVPNPGGADRGASTKGDAKARS